MVKQSYPRVEVNLQYLKENVAAVVERCADFGIDIAGVIKGTTGIPECAKMFEEGGAKLIASSRLEQIEDAKTTASTCPICCSACRCSANCQRSSDCAISA